MKKAVFIYTNFNFSVKNAGVTRMMYYARSIAGNETSVYLASCSHGSMTHSDFDEIHPNVFLLRTDKITNSFRGTMAYVKNYYAYSKSVSDNAVFLFYPSPLVYLEIIALYYLKFRKKCKLYYEMNEVRKYSSTFHNALSLKRPLYSLKKILYKSVFNLLEFGLKYYDGLICISTAIEAYGQKFNNNTVRIPILTDPHLKKIFSDKSYAQKGKFNIGFSGSVHPTKENLVEFIHVLSKIKKKGFKFSFNLCGPLESKHKKFLFENLVSDLNLTKSIKYYGRLNAKELSTFLDQQQLLVIPRGFTLQNNFGFSTKLSDYLNHGKPVLVTDVSDNKLFIKDGENGFIVQPDNNELMFNKLVDIMNNYDKLSTTIINNASETSKRQFYYKKFHDTLVQFFFKSESRIENQLNI